jgi:hypothetical protein
MSSLLTDVFRKSLLRFVDFGSSQFGFKRMDSWRIVGEPEVMERSGLLE